MRLLLALAAALAWADAPPPPDTAAQARTLAERIVRAPDDAAREALYAAAPPELRGWTLGAALLERARSHMDAGETGAAGRGFAWALRLAEEAGDLPAQARALNAGARYHSQRGDYEAAAENLRRSEGIAAALGDEKLVASARANRAIVHRFLGEYDEALALYESARGPIERDGDPMRMATLLNNVGVVHVNRGDHRRALTLFERALATAPPGDSVVADAHSNIALIHAAQGDLDLAAEYQGRALAQDERAARGDRLPYAFGMMGDLARKRGRAAEAASWFEKARVGAVKVEDAAVESEALTRLGELAAERGAAAEALALLERGRARAAATGEREGEARAEIALARTLLGAGRAADGLVHAEAAVARAERMHAPALLWQARTVSGRALAALGRTDAASAAFERAVVAIEEWREQAAGDDERFLEDKLEPYHALVGLHAAAGDLDRALSWAEQAHARTLTDALRHGRVDLAGQLAPAERDEQLLLERRLVSLHLKRVAAARAAEGTGAQDDAIARTRLELAAFRARAFAARPDLRLSSGPVASDPLADAAPLLDARTAVVVYTAAAERLHLFVLTREDGRVRPTYAALPIGARDLAARVGRFRALLATRDLGVRAEARRLHDDLVAPVADRLRGRTRLVIVPDGALWELPFAALSPRAGRYLLEDTAVSLAPSLAALAALRARGQAPNAIGSVLAVGDPSLPKTADASLGRLPGAARQARAIGRLYAGPRSRVLVADEAREERVRADAPTVDVLHLATHGAVDDASPLFSYLVLAGEGDEPERDGRLEAREVLRMRLDARLVVLSACETGRGRVGAGEGTIGLSWAFALAGSPTVVASHWKVDERSASDLMVAFHRRLRADDTDVATALRSAALGLTRDPRYRHPFYWAGFFAVGEARAR